MHQDTALIAREALECALRDNPDTKMFGVKATLRMPTDDEAKGALSSVYSPRVADIMALDDDNVWKPRFKAVSAKDAYEYMVKESVWGLRQYAELLFWDVTAVEAQGEFVRAAMAGEIKTAGRDKNTQQIVYPSKSYWKTAELWGGGDIDDVHVSNVGSLPRLYRLSVCEDDMRKTWPNASLARRVWTEMLVKAKKAAIMRGLWTPARPAS